MNRTLNPQPHKPSISHRSLRLNLLHCTVLPVQMLVTSCYMLIFFEFEPQVRFDDTNPTKEKDEYVENIIKDMQTLGLQYKTITYTSDYFPQVQNLPKLLLC
jgi:hypothetical protein